VERFLIIRYCLLLVFRHYSRDPILPMIYISIL
jgi:hypothetical protein